jgi:hypothetical protein
MEEVDSTLTQLWCDQWSVGKYSAEHKSHTACGTNPIVTATFTLSKFLGGLIQVRFTLAIHGDPQSKHV